jgi:hypothetical protein
LRATLPLCLCALLLTGCGWTGFAPSVGPGAALPRNLPDRCGLAPLLPLTGQPLTVLADLALTAELRVIWPGQEVTTAPQSDRLNAEVSDDGRIVSLFCG